jgi:carbonic anhydrase
MNYECLYRACIKGRVNQANDMEKTSMRRKTAGFCAIAALSLLSPSSGFTGTLQTVDHPSETVEAYRQRQEQVSPDDVLAWLKAGNRRFVSGKSTHGGCSSDARARIKIASKGQRPLAVVLSCIDSRTSPELVFDVSVGDLFTSRIGANVVNDDVLGSLEIAAASGAKVIVILGHTDCGGVKGACSGLELGHATQMLEKVKPAIATTNARLDADLELSHFIGPRQASNPRYIAEVSHANARQSVEQVLERSPLLMDQVKRGEILIVSALYHVETGEVSFDLPSTASISVK